MYSSTLSIEASAPRSVLKSSFLALGEASSSSWIISVVGEFPNLSFSPECSYVDSIQRTVSYSGAGRSLLLCNPNSQRSGQSTLKPEILSNLPPLLCGCRDVNCLAIEGSSISYVFLSSESSTLILKSQSGQLTEVIDPSAAFHVEGPTLLAFSVVLPNSFVVLVQVTTSAILILSSIGRLLFRWEISSLSNEHCSMDKEIMEIGDNDLYRTPVDMPSSPIKSSHISSLISFSTSCDSYLSIILENGSLYLFVVNESSFLKIIYDSTATDNNLTAKSCSITRFCSAMIMAVHYTHNVDHLDSVAFYLLPSMEMIWQTMDIAKLPYLLSFSSPAAKQSITMQTEQPPISLLEFSITQGSCGSMLLILRYTPSFTTDDSSFTSIYYSRAFSHLLEQANEEHNGLYVSEEESRHATMVSFTRLDHEFWCNFSYIRKSIVHLGAISPILDAVLVLGSEISYIIFIDKSKTSSLPVLAEICFPEGAYPVAASPIMLSDSLTLLSLTSSNGLMIYKPFSSTSSPTPFWGLPEAKTILWDRKLLRFKPGLSPSGCPNDNSTIISMLRYDPESHTHISVLETPVPFIIPPTEAELALAKENNKQISTSNGAEVSMMAPHLMTTPFTVSSFLELISPVSWLIIDR